jgi:membrane fusion protein, multidrug efflux system
MAAPSLSAGQRSGRRRSFAPIILVGLLGAVAAGGAVWWFETPRAAHATISPAAYAPPVSVAAATPRDVPVYLVGLGAVQASNTTAIHTQVDGTLQSVNFVEGQEVHKGDVLAQIDPHTDQAALDEAKAKKAQDEAQLVSAQKDLERIQDLLKVKPAVETPQDLDHQIALVGQLKATIESDQAAIESAQTELDYTTITAPTDGRVGIRQVDPGNVVQTTDTTPIVVLTQTKPAAVVFSLPEKDLGDVRKAMQAGPLDVVAFDQDDRAQLAQGKLLLIDNEADQTTGTIKLKALFPNKDEALWPGQFVNVRLLLRSQSGLTIPSAAVQRGPDGLYAWVVGSDGRVSMRALKTGPVDGDTTIVTAGLAERDRVVVDGQSKLQPNAPVTVATTGQFAGQSGYKGAPL